MRIAIYTLTRDRIEYTQQCFASLYENAGAKFDHYILDNGSVDGTRQWLNFQADAGKFKWYSPQSENLGISVASNMLLRRILQEDYDVILKFDNDCFVRTPNILQHVAEVVTAAGENWIFSPRVEGINKQPRRVRNVEIAGHPIGVVGIVGGLFHVVPASAYRLYVEQGGYPEHLPKARGQDDQLCAWWRRRGENCGYIEDVIVEHYETTDGQARRYPEYFERKWMEEKE